MGRSYTAGRAEKKTWSDQVYLRQWQADSAIRQCFISVDVEEDLVGDVIKIIGEENVVISTDHPHADSHWPDAVNHFMAMELPSSAQRKILWDNCTRLYAVN